MTNNQIVNKLRHLIQQCRASQASYVKEHLIELDRVMSARVGREPLPVNERDVPGPG